MKRTRPSIKAISIFAIASLSPQLHLTTAASLRATHSPVASDSESGISISGGGNGNGGSGSDNEQQPVRSSSPLHPLPLPSVVSQKKKPLTVKLSSSSHPRAHVSDKSQTSNDAPFIPLIGVGVGNLPHNKIPYILASALSTNKKKNRKKKKGGMDYEEELDYRLVDTSHTDSALEVLVGRSLSRLSVSPSGGSGNNKNLQTSDVSDNSVYHVMIKIWHTHLGYERTMLSVQDSLSDMLPGFSIAQAVADNDNNPDATTIAKGHPKKASSNGGAAHPDVRIHAILQYPRCYDNLFSSESYLNSPNFPTKYNSCQEEEDNALDATTKQLGGRSPLLDKESAWKRSYRALEELYHHGTLESIGVSNFGPSDLTQLFDLATVGPHVYQGSLSMLLTQEELVEELVKHGVHYQCYDVASTIMNGKEGAPRAYAKLERIGARHGGMLNKYDGSDVYGYSPIQVVMGWLVHHRGVGVVPGTTNPSHLAENSPRSLGTMPKFNPREVLDVETAVLALVNGQDIVDAEKTNKKEGMEEIISANGSSQSMGDDTNLTAEGEGGVVATFFNTASTPTRSIRIFQVHGDTGEQIQISHSIPPGRSGRMIVNLEDVLIAYDGHGVAVQKFLVEGTETVDDGEEGEGNDNGSGTSLDFMVE